MESIDICSKDGFPPTIYCHKEYHANTKIPFMMFRGKALSSKYAEVKDISGMIPLHHACLKGYSFGLVKILIQAYPTGISVRDEMARTPLDCYMSIQGRQSNHEVIALLKGETEDCVIKIRSNQKESRRY